MGTIGRHHGGPICQVSRYVSECWALDGDSLSLEYSRLVDEAPRRSREFLGSRDISAREPNSNRLEELLAHQIYTNDKGIDIAGTSAVRFVDFQTPLKEKQKDAVGKVDLLGVSDGLWAIELKVLRPNRSADTPLAALLEVVGHCAALEGNFTSLNRELASRDIRIATDRITACVLAPTAYWTHWDQRRTAVDWRSAIAHAASTLSSATGLSIRFGMFDATQISGPIRVSSPLA